jgi:hypothetical protein
MSIVQPKEKYIDNPTAEIHRNKRNLTSLRLRDWRFPINRFEYIENCFLIYNF